MVMGYNGFSLSRDFGSKDHVTLRKVAFLGILVNHHPVKFSGHRHCGNGFSLSRDLVKPRDQRVE